MIPAEPFCEKMRFMGKQADSEGQICSYVSLQ